ncbi:MAG: GNAT family N-acetyltransferase [Propionicimonas sp.]
MENKVGDAMSLRDAHVTDLPRLQEVERKAGEVFRHVGMNAVADDEPLSVDLLRGYVDRGTAWVIADHADVPVACLIADVVDGSGHIEQVSVIPVHARQGLGRVLLDHACEWALSNGLRAVTLTTFANVPWNGPYYEGCGFRRLPADDLTPGLLRLLREEADHGLDAWPRVCMRRLLDVVVPDPVCQVRLDPPDRDVEGSRAL